MPLANKMNGRPTSHSYALKIRLLILVAAAVLVWAGIMFPLLSYTLEGSLNRSVKAMQDMITVSATTIARLMVLEFSQWQDLLQLTFEENKKGEERIKNLLWEKVVFNEVIEGIELIQAVADDQDRHLTYMYYRGAALSQTTEPKDTKKQKPMEGPQKVKKKFTGLEKELIDGINTRKKVDKLLLESINQGVLGSEMTTRYLPVQVLVREQGPVYWGVAKIGVNTSAIRVMRLLQGQELDRIRRIIWLEIFLSVGLVTGLAMALGYRWVRNYTEPLKELEIAARGMNNAKPEEFNFWVNKLRFVEPNKQQEIDSIREILLRMAGAMHRIGQRLITTERQAAWGRVASGIVSTTLHRLQAIRVLEGQVGPEASAAGNCSQELKELFDQLQTELQDLAEFVPAVETQWQAVDLLPALHSAWRLITANLPATVRLTLELAVLPPVRGSAADLKLAIILLLEYAGRPLEPNGELTLRAWPDSPPGGVCIQLQFSGPRLSPEDCQSLLNPFQAPDDQQPLGPALAAAIATEHGGRLNVETWENGLIFLLILPKEPLPDEIKET